MAAPNPITFEPTARERLRTLTADPEADFREGQLRAITDLVVDRSRVLCVQRTGWGKSAVYFVATSLLRSDRERPAGPTLIVSPLLALMRNQIAAAQRLGLRAQTINSTNRDDWEAVREQLDADTVDLLLISPERLNNPQFRETMLPLFAQRVGLLVIDEAHCISDWGHDFRPDYRRVKDMLDALPANVAVLGTTATANDRVVADVVEQLASADIKALRSYRGSLARTSLRLEVLELPRPAQRLAWLVEYLPQLPGSISSRDHSAAKVAQLVALAIRRLTEHQGQRQLAGIGLSVPGWLIDHDQIAYNPNLKWNSVPFASRLMQALDEQRIHSSVNIGNDANLGALAEHIRGASQEANDLIFLLGRRGVGAGVISGGALLLGRSGSFGELGHIALDPNGPPCHCGRRGCIETFIGDNALLRAAGVERPTAKSSVAKVIAAAELDDRQARAAVTTTARYLGQTIAMLTNLFNPSVIVFAGTFAELLRIARPEIERSAQERTLATAWEGLTLRTASAGGGEASLTGAAELAFASYLEDPVP